MSGTEPSAGQLREALQDFLRRELGADADPVVNRLARSGTGSSRENWPFDATWTQDGVRGEHRLLMRRDPLASVVDTARSTEFALLKALQHTTIPAPAVRWLDDSGAQLSRPTMIGDRYEGSAHRAVLRDRNPLKLTAEQRGDLARQMCDVLAALHCLDVADLGLSGLFDRPAPSPAAYELHRWVAELDAVELEPQPGLRLCVDWLRDNIPAPPQRIVLVHGDFRPANVLVSGGQLSVLLDWELAHLGDPLDDLGWYTTPLYRVEHFIPGAWEPDDFLVRYTAATGIEVPKRALEFWQIMATFRLAVIALTGVRNFCEHRSDRPAGPADAVVARVIDQILDAEKG